MLVCHARWARLYLQYSRLAERIEADPAKLEYMDTALAPVFEAGEEELDRMKTHQAAIPDNRSDSTY